MPIVKSFRFRLEPNAFQRLQFTRYAGCCRFVFNQGLANRKATYETTRQTLTYVDQCKALTAMKKAEGTAWLAEVHSQVLQQALKDLQTSFDRFFQRIAEGKTSGFPKFKKRGKKDTFRYPQGIKINGNLIYLPKIGWVRYRQSRPIEGKILQATIKREIDHWFVCLTCQTNRIPQASARSKPQRFVGIDLGIKTFATLSDGTWIDNPRHLDAVLDRLKRAQHLLSRKTKGSSRWEKQRRRVAKLHLRVKDSRRDFLHKASTAIVKSHDVIAVEDLNIEGMIQNRRLSRAISDAGWGLFLRLLCYKAEWQGKHMVRVGRFEATTQSCSACSLKKPMPLTVRIYTCESCGLSIDRDWNASLNIKAAGLAVFYARGEE